MNDSPDYVDHVLDQWKQERSDLDASSMGIIGRLHRISGSIRTKQRSVLAEADLQHGEFDILLTLRRHGAPYSLSAGSLSASTMVTPGAMTHRADRLIAKGLVARREDPANRRSMLISLTPKGLELVDQLVERHIAFQEQLLDGLTGSERDALASLLRKLGQSVDRESDAS